MVTRLRAGRFGVRIPAEARNFFLLQKSRLALESSEPALEFGIGVLSRRYSSRRVNLTTYLNSMKW
jgi:hypothetical protein